MAIRCYAPTIAALITDSPQERGVMALGLHMRCATGAVHPLFQLFGYAESEGAALPQF
jgi:hypothetical protein